MHKDAMEGELRVSEGDASERSATTGIVHNLSHHALDVSLALGVVQGTELGNTLAKMGVGLEHSALRTLSLTYTLGEKGL